MKKIFALILAAALVLALVPAVAMAATEVTDQTSLQNALNAGGEVKLANDITLTSAVSVNAGKTVVLDLNGKTISLVDSSGAACYMIKNSGTLTIKDSSAAGTGKITFTSTTPDASYGYSTSTIGNGGAGGTLVVESGTIENNTVGGASYAIDNFWYTDDVAVTIKGGTITAKGIAVRQVPFSTTAKNTLNITGDACITGGTSAVQTFNYNDGACLAEVNISGGTLKGTYSYYTSYTKADNHAGTDIEITGGELSGYVYIYNGNAGSASTEFKNVSIKGGEFSMPPYIFTTETNEDEAPVAAISGGEYAYQPDAAYVDPNALVIDTNKGDTPYMIGDDAEEALASGESDTVEVLQAPAGAELDVAPGVKVTNATANDIKVNGETLSEGEEYYQDPPNDGGEGGDPIPETGDGMEVFLFGGMMIVALLGMALLSKRSYTRA